MKIAAKLTVVLLFGLVGCSADLSEEALGESQSAVVLTNRSLRMNKSSMCIRDDGTLKSNTCPTPMSQRWTFVAHGGGRYMIKRGTSPDCIRAPTSFPDGNTVTMAQFCAPTEENLWKVIGNLASTFQLESARWPQHFCINEDGTNVYGNVQHLRLRPCVTSYPAMHDQEMFLDDY